MIVSALRRLIDHAQPQLSVGPARADALEIGRQITLEPLFGERAAVAEQAEPDSAG